MYTVGAETLGFKQRKHQDWFDDYDLETNGLLEEKHREHLIVLNTTLDQEVEKEACCGFLKSYPEISVTP